LVKIQTLSRRESLRIIEAAKPLLRGLERIDKARSLRALIVDERRRLLYAEDLMLVEVDSRIAPFLGFSEALETLPKIVVDSGAIPHICNGADVMRPGIVRFEESFKADDLVAVKEERYGKFLAVGVATVSSDEAESMGRGVVVRNLHYVGDKLWEASKLVK